jgi:prepilin-type N-terminal cleavage/methylation domain-containing protein/prepilin-type processing-associated H-X9-DG protein
MKTPHLYPTDPARSTRGFTLTELLVSIVIIVVLALLSFVGIRSFREKAWAANSSSNLRQNGVAINSYLSDEGHYPEAWDFGGGSGGGSWSWQIRSHLGYQNDKTWPVEAILHPRHGRKGIDALSGADRENLHHYAASAIILQDVDESQSNSTKTYIRAAQVSDPSSIIMLGDVPLKKPLQPAGGAHAAWWSLRFAAVKGSPNDPVDQSALLKSVDFWINGKAQFLFADGHVETLAPKEVKKKHFQL